MRYSGIVRVNYDPSTEFCSIVTPISIKRVSDFIRYNVKPISYRRWDDKTRRWEVHITKIAPVILYTKSFFDYVDYRSLPESAQIKLVAEMERLKAGKKGPFTKEDISPLIKESPHDVLFLAPNAPWEVIKAAHKALVSMHHPDHGGDTAEFRRVQEAYEELKKNREPKLS
jgi:hypothetical protein